MVVWVQNGCCPASRESIVLHIASPGKDQNSNFEVRFLLNAYCFHTIIELKNRKLNHCKLETVSLNTIFFVFLENNLFIYLFIFGCVESSLLRAGFL